MDMNYLDMVSDETRKEILAEKAEMEGKGYVQVVGMWLKPGTKKYVTTMLDIKHFDDLAVGETGR